MGSCRPERAPSLALLSVPGGSGALAGLGTSHRPHGWASSTSRIMVPPLGLTVVTPARQGTAPWRMSSSTGSPTARLGAWSPMPPGGSWLDEGSPMQPRGGSPRFSSTSWPSSQEARVVWGSPALVGMMGQGCGAEGVWGCHEPPGELQVRVSAHLSGSHVALCSPRSRAAPGGQLPEVVSHEP